MHIPSQLHSKLEAKSERLVFVGYESEGKAFRVWHPGTQKNSITTDLVVHEDSICKTFATNAPRNPSKINFSFLTLDNVVAPIPVFNPQMTVHEN